ncbi:serine/threonine-protein phosphatase 4 regulatory subunit 4 isoform X5 [Carlito syrichta]|uniref:Serine/threonine-protein phosphatase 4 regulatory subunit 4 isoform X5 n=1 Tax=Carlito syrichta TaxID=1868482 RepID=A0A3Q0DID1_CARSF|nr:serine/threonine-protein phosphatase 4 regulatory subunit 4 isoform X5 [Carlito syrichta]
MRQNPSETLRRVFPKVREALHVAGVEMQLTAAVSFLTILQEEAVSIHAYAHSFLQVILLHLEHRDAGVSNAWLETLLSVIEVLPRETLRHEILNPLVSKAQLSQTVQSRLVSCKILGKLTNKFDAHIIKREILPLVKSLCQDVEYEVRSCMCRQLENIAQGIGTELTKSVVLPELIELSRDEGSSVRLAAFETLVNLLDVFDTEYRRPDTFRMFLETGSFKGGWPQLAGFCQRPWRSGVEVGLQREREQKRLACSITSFFPKSNPIPDDRSQTILPLVKSFCEKSFKADESILISLSFHLGKLCHGLYGIFTPDQHLRFLEFYKKLCTLGLQQENGHNDNQIPPQILEQEKKYISVRKNCAYNFPAMIVFVDPKNFHLELYPTFFCLCHDPEVPVRYTIAICFYEVSKLLNSGVYLIHKELITLLQDESLEVLDALIDHLPEILELMSTGGESSVQENKNVLPVQKAASRTLCVFLRYNRKQEQRHEVIQKLIEQLGQGKSYWNRLRFLDTCEFIIEIFSKAFFCKYFFLPAIELTHDPVANVRMKLCYLLPKVKSTLKIPADKHLLQQLEMCVRKLLCQEKDKDVLAIVKRTVLELDRMEMSMDAFQKKFYEKDLVDQEKEREERLLLEMEQLEREKQQNDGRPMSDKIFEKKRRDSKTPTQSLPKGIPVSVPGPSSVTPSTSKEIKKSKLVRSQSFNNQAFHAKYGSLEKCASKSSAAGYTPPVSGLAKTSVLSVTDDSFRTRNASSLPPSFSPPSSLPSTSRGTAPSVDPKGSASKDSQPRKATFPENPILKSTA